MRAARQERRGRGEMIACMERTRQAKSNGPSSARRAGMAPGMAKLSPPPPPPHTHTDGQLSPLAWPCQPSLSTRTVWNLPAINQASASVLEARAADVATAFLHFSNYGNIWL